MIECDFGAPSSLAVTGFAPAADLAAMRVFAAVATHTVLGELLSIHRCGVADVTVSLGVRAHQRELGFRCVVISHRLPSVVVMAVVALGTETQRMSVIRLVTAVAVLRNLVLVISTAMAGKAVDVRVYAQQRVAGLLEMIVLRSLPFLRRMALCAVFASRAAVFIVGRVATDAGFRGRLVAARDVARIASHRRMGACQ